MENVQQVHGCSDLAGQLQRPDEIRHHRYLHWSRRLGWGTYAVVAKASTKELVRFETNGTYSGADKKWSTAEGGADTGVVFVDGKFRSLSGAGRISEYSNAETGDNSPDWWAAYRWETDADNNDYLDYTSRISPPTRFTWPRRARLKVLGSPLPVGVGSIGGYTAKKSTKPTRAEMIRSFTHFVGGQSVAYWYYYEGTGGIPADSNTFPTATPSSIVSASKTFEVKGDGSGRWGPLTFNANGTATGVPKVASGTATVNITSANGRASATVTFPAGLFSTTPNVIVSVDTAYPVVMAASYQNASATGVTLWGRRDTTGLLTISWIATGA